MCERQAGGYSLEKIITILVSQCDKETIPLSHWLTVFRFSGLAFDGSIGGESSVAAGT